VSEAARPRRIRPFPFDRLARLARSQVEAGRALLGHLPLHPGPAWAEAAAALGGGAAGPSSGVRFELVEAYAFPVRELGQRIGAGVTVQLAAPGDRNVLIVVDPALAPRLARRALGVDAAELPAPRPLTPAEQGALAFLCAALVGGVGVRVMAVGEPPPPSLFPDPSVVALEARVETPVGAGWARLLAPDRARLWLPRPHAAPALLAHAARLCDARVHLRMEVGRTRLPRAEFARLERGDVVLFDEFGPRPPFGGPLQLKLGRGGFRADLGGDGLTILAHFHTGAPAMSDLDDDDLAPPAPAPDAATTDALLRELPVEVVCELGRVTMTGRELLELRPGAVLPVGRPLAGPVDLTVGGRIVARGELVDVEGEIGVRILQVNE